jgi:elongation factor Tu
MLTGAIQMEGAILVVSVNDGPQVQTREHIILAKEVGISYMVVYINKLDALVELEMKELVELEIRELLDRYGFPDDLPVLKGSAKKALEETPEQASEIGLKSVQNLMDTVDEYIPQPERLLDAPFLLPIEAVYVITGRGTVVTGKIEQGTVTENEEVDLVGKDIKKTTCLGIEMYHKLLSKAEVGDNVGILIKNIKKGQVSRGYVLASVGSMGTYRTFTAKAYILSKKEGGRHKPFLSNYKPQFFFRTSNVTGAIVLPEEVSLVLPGDSLTFKVQLVDPCPLNNGLKFVMREGTLTIGAVSLQS